MCLALKKRTISSIKVPELSQTDKYLFTKIVYKYRVSVQMILRNNVFKSELILVVSKLEFNIEILPFLIVLGIIITKS